MTTAIHVPSTPQGTLSDAWRHCVGTGEFVLGMRQDYQDSLAVTQESIGFKHIRGHGIFHEWLGILRKYDVAGHVGTRYSWTYLDLVVDAYMAIGIKPILELGFMPEDLASGTDTVFWWKGNITPPSDYGQWTALVKATLRHLIDRYGRDEVLTWPVEVWNEPSLVQFWKDASKPEYFKLYDHTAAAIKEVDADFQVGGPATSPQSDDWYVPFAEHTAASGAPVDFFSFHAYTTGPAQHVPFGTYQTMHGADSLLEQFSRPRRILLEAGSQAARDMAGKPMYVTEFNTSYRPDNPVHDTAYNAAYLAPTLVGGGSLVDSMSYWTFSDMFEEVGIPTSIFHGGFGLLTHRQIKKPTFHLYAFMARLHSQVLSSGDDHVVTRDPATGRLAILAWQPAGGTDDAVEAASHQVSLSVPIDVPTDRSGPVADALAALTAADADAVADAVASKPSWVYIHRSRVNNDDGNAFTAWQQMGRPASPSHRQLEALYEAAEPAVSHARGQVDGQGRVLVDVALASHEVTLLELDPVWDQTPSWIDDARIIGR